MTKSTSRRTLAALASAALMFSTGAVRADQNPSTADATSVAVTVNYTGAGTVDADHRLWVWIFDNPNIGPDAIPIGEQSIAKNGGTARFSTTTPVYVAIAYDEKGGFMGQAPPPPGSPVALYGMTGPNDPPQPVTPRPKGSVSVTFDDTQRMP
ncbi:MAG TPA: hypothetical protein VMO26_12615 [Vicinamibacterales bacterium]|nr:hypothetical protein [Vicinamibacterales bacterium]